MKILVLLCYLHIGVARSEIPVWEEYVKNHDVCLVQGRLMAADHPNYLSGEKQSANAAHGFFVVRYSKHKLVVSRFLSDSSWARNISVLSADGKEPSIDVLVTNIDTDSARVSKVTDGDGLFILANNGPLFAVRYSILSRIREDQIEAFRKQRKSFISVFGK